jgi:hypothetical protein
MARDFDSSLYLWEGTLEPVGISSSYFEECLHKSLLQTFSISHESLTLSNSPRNLITLLLLVALL